MKYKKYILVYTPAFLGIVLIGLVTFTFSSLTRDPAKQAVKLAENNLYDSAAYEATSIFGTLTTNPTMDTLQSRSMDTSGYNVTFGAATALSPTAVYWDARAEAQGDATVFLKHEVKSVHACLRYTADIKAMTVLVQPKKCSEITLATFSEASSNSEEILLNVDKINSIRQSNNDLYYCYESRSPEVGGKNASSSECK